ncbi:hypothetical protein A3J98_00910 [candidate division WS6 bacterium RIFOXYC1_FULL_33_10]|uniref:Uncharacterized protein n=1 Tax=candidate division WS6 bacterium RIFOXYC1_FULL_33_10 TaxID=1802606 RepID=A0A1F4UJJ6_9BACT|nr:MAG: hypothetical protein A3J98_00910 [candidate division WS6 bacterium RIFOXYC1_FULL_33_10]
MEFNEKNIGQEPIREQYLFEEAFEGLESKELIPYTGEGKTSYASKDSKGNSYDLPKKEYLEQLGIETPKDWLSEDGELREESRALFISMFITTGNILVTESIRRTLGDDTDTFKEVLDERNRQLDENRVDKYGYRRVLPNGTLVEDSFTKMNLSSNPEKRVSKDELYNIVDYVFTQLKRE